MPWQRKNRRSKRTWEKAIFGAIGSEELWYNSSMDEFADTAVLEKMLDPITQAFTPEVAQRVIALRADAPLQALVDQLGDKANEGTLSEIERRQYESYVRASTLISILQAKARKLLANGNAS